MKKLSLFVLGMSLCLCGCGTDTVSHTEVQGTHIDTMKQPIIIPGTPSFTASEKCFYHLSEMGALFGYDTSKNSMHLSNVAYVDGKEAEDPSVLAAPEKYTDSAEGGMTYVNGNLMYISNYRNTEGVSEYHINTLNEKGEDVKTFLKLEYVPASMAVQDFTLAIVEESEKASTIHFYDLSGKELNTTKLDGYIEAFQAVDDGFVVNVDNSTLYKIPLTELSKKEKLLDVQDTLHYVQGKYAIFWKFDVPENFNEIQDTSLIGKSSYLVDLDTKDIILSFENELIDMIDEEHIYTTDVTEQNVKYHIYDWEQKQQKELCPSTIIGEAPNYRLSSMYTTQDYSNIQALWKDQIFISSLDESNTVSIYACDIEEGSCKVAFNYMM